VHFRLGGQEGGTTVGLKSGWTQGQ